MLLILFPIPIALYNLHFHELTVYLSFNFVLLGIGK
jgi:hypothetical protein